MQHDEWGRSGSRWEPAPQVAPGTAPAAASAPTGSTDVLTARVGTRPRRRHRRPVVAVLLTLLGVGAVTAGAAYVQGDGTPAATPTGQASSQVAGGDDHGRHGHGPDGDHQGGSRDGARSGDDQPAVPSGASS